MDKKNLPSDSANVIRKVHQQVTKANNDAEESLSTLSTSPARSTWSPVPSSRSTSTAYSNTASNATAMDFSTRTGISPCSFSPASDGMRTAVAHTPARRRSLSRGSVLTQETRSRPAVRRSDIAANIQRHQDGMETARSASPKTAYSPGGLSAITARPISDTSRPNYITPIPLPDGGVLSPSTGLWRTGITPEGRTPGRSFQSRKSSKATKTAVGTPSMKSTKTAHGKSPIVARTPGTAPGTPAGRPKSTIKAIPPGTPGSRFERGNLSQKSAKSTKAAVGTPGNVVVRTPVSTPRSTITAIPPGTPRNLSQRSIKSTKTAIGTPGGRLNTPRTPGGPASQKSAKSLNTALSANAFVGRTPYNTPASSVASGGLSQRSSKSAKAAIGTPRNQVARQQSENSVEIPMCRTPLGRPMASKKSLRKTSAPTPEQQVSSTATAITPNGASATTARSIQTTAMNTAWTPGTPITLGSSMSPEPRTAMLLSAPSTPYKGLKAARSGPRSSSISESLSSSSEKNMRTAKGTKSQDKTLEASGRNYQAVPDSPPLVIVQTTSFSRTPTHSDAGSATNTAIAPDCSNRSSKSSKKSTKSAKAISPGYLSARAARPASMETPKSARKSTNTAISTGIRTPITARSAFTPITAKPNTAASTRSGKQHKSRLFTASIKNLKSAKKSAQNSKIQDVSKKSAASTKSFQSGVTTTASEIDPEMLKEAKNNQKIVMTSALPDGSFKVVVQLSVRAAGTPGRVNISGRAPEGMITKKVTVNGSDIYQA